VRIAAGPARIGDSASERNTWDLLATALKPITEAYNKMMASNGYDVLENLTSLFATQLLFSFNPGLRLSFLVRR
jgi:hypothetical protein